MKKTIITAVLTALVMSASATAVTKALITTEQIKNGTIRMADLHITTKNALRGQRGPIGPVGAQGPQGAPGATGVAGGFDPAKVIYVTGPTISVASGQVLGTSAACPPGTKAIGGGGFNSITNLGYSQASGGGAGWSIIVANDTSIQVDNIAAFAVCAAP